MKTEAALERKKEENAALRLHIQHYEIKWNQYESKMKAMEKMWQDQLTSIQVSVLQITSYITSVRLLSIIICFNQKRFVYLADKSGCRKGKTRGRKD